MYVGFSGGAESEVEGVPADAPLRDLTRQLREPESRGAAAAM